MNPDPQLTLAVRALQREHRSRRSRPRGRLEMEALLEDAATAAEAAADCRQRWARRSSPKNAERLAALDSALAALRSVSVGLKQEGGRLPRAAIREQRWGPQLRRASARVQAERRKLSKMRRRGAES